MNKQFANMPNDEKRDRADRLNTASKSLVEIHYHRAQNIPGVLIHRLSDDTYYRYLHDEISAIDLSKALIINHAQWVGFKGYPLPDYLYRFYWPINE